MDTAQLEKIKDRLVRMRDEDLLQMVQVDAAEYRLEVIRLAEAEIAYRGLLVNPTAPTGDALDEAEAAAALHVFLVPTLAADQEAAEASLATAPNDLPDRDERLRINQFRMLIFVTQILILKSYVLPSTVPNDILDAVYGPPGTGVPILGALTLPDVLYYATMSLDVLSFLAAIGLLFFQRWGRTLWVVVLLARAFVYALTPMSVGSGVDGAFVYLIDILAGIVLAMSYFPSLRQKFALSASPDEA